jgi:hypothetical protein
LDSTVFQLRIFVFLWLTLIVNTATGMLEIQQSGIRIAASLLTAFVCCYFIRNSKSLLKLCVISQIFLRFNQDPIQSWEDLVPVLGFLILVALALIPFLWQDFQYFKNLLKYMLSYAFFKAFWVRLILFCVVSEGFIHFRHQQQMKYQQSKDPVWSDAVLLQQQNEWIYHPQTLLNDTALIAQLKDNMNLEKNSTCPAAAVEVKQELLLPMDDVSSSPSSDPDTAAWTTAAKWAVGLAAGAVLGYKVWTYPSIQKAIAETLLIEVEASAPAANILHNNI